MYKNRAPEGGNNICGRRVRGVAERRFSSSNRMVV